MESNTHRMKLKMLLDQQKDAMKDMTYLLNQLHSTKTLPHDEYHKDLRKQKIAVWKRLSRCVRNEEKLWGEILVKKC